MAKIITRGIIDWGTLAIEECESYEYAGPLTLLKDSGSPPQPVDPYTQAGAQYGLSTGTASYNAGLNRTNASNPLGSSTWTASYGQPTPPSSSGNSGSTGLFGPSASGPGASFGFGGSPAALSGPAMGAYRSPSYGMYAGGPGGDPRGGAPTYTETTHLAPQFESALQKPIDTSGIIGAPGGPNALGARSQIQDALYQQQAQYLNPQFQLSDEQLQSQLANQGITQGSEAWKNAMDQQNRNKTFAYGNAANQAITGATGQTQALQQMGIAGLGANITARDAPINEYESLLGRGGGSATAQTPDISGAFGQQYQGALAGYNAQNAANNQTNADVMSLIAAGLMFFSDRRLKTDVERIGCLSNGIPVYRFRYKWGPQLHIGVMADEVKKVNPDAVVEIDGIQLVNYGAL